MALVYGIVYATASKMLRRVVVPHDGSNLAFLQHAAGPGESVLAVPAGNNHQYADWIARIASATGVTPPSPACAVVDQTNTVIAVVMADPALDSHPQGSLVWCYSPQIGIGCTYDPASGLFTAPGYTFPPKPGVPGGTVPPTIIPKP